MATESGQIFPILKEEPVELDQKESLLNLVDFGINILRAKRSMASEKNAVDPTFFRIVTQEIQDTLDNITHDIITAAVHGKSLPYSDCRSYDIFSEN